MNMDIDQDGELLDGRDEAPGQIILPSEAMPGIIHIIPQEHRPFFPGQAIPLIMGADTWLSTLEAVRSRGQDVIGLIATKHEVDGIPEAPDLFEMGCLCKIHRVHREGDQLQVLLEGIQRFQVRKWIKSSAPLTASIESRIASASSRRGGKRHSSRAAASTACAAGREALLWR